MGPSEQQSSRVVVAHDYLTQRGGGERVALSLAQAFSARIVTSVYAPDRTFPEFRAVDITTGPLQRVPLLRSDPRLALPLLARAWQATRADDAGVVIASTSGWAHGIGVRDGGVLVAYCHNPARWLYQTADYLSSRRQRAAFWPVRAGLRRWDQAAASRVDVYVANSSSVATRIQQVYGREATVVHPPVCLDVQGAQEPVPGLRPGFWLTVARGRGYKNTRAVIDGVLASAEGELAVVGSPPPGVATEPGVHWLGIVSDAQLRWLYAHARALVAVSHEDFGLTPLEANAFGTPVAVLRAGGYLDSTHEGVSGVFIDEPVAASVAASLRSFPDLDVTRIRQHAARFSQAAFSDRMHDVVASAVTGRSAVTARLAAPV